MRRTREIEVQCDERRRHERFGFEAEAFVRWGSYVYWANLEEIGLGGFRLNTMAPVRGGVPFTVQLRLPAACGAQMERPVFRVRMQWRRSNVMGVQLAGRQGEALRVLRRFLRDYFVASSQELSPQYSRPYGEGGLEEMDTLVWARS